ncbi:hypothetical protein [Marinitoga sp. 38H-ov]|uniref:hypothetical protein n=1 Tax=Marinitoga sp. 38H-ov TaxID=1755814 RepID=UPI0013EA4D6D|nr:hypothetical protein [Marinitoga sp. 38H-ov]KAF2956246.1 hypothetical protein AS160_00170 [Marinitoga sp. 38H-ov]
MIFERTKYKYDGEIFFGVIPENKMPFWTIPTNNFYLSSYVCPECGRLMVKTVFSVDFTFSTVDGSIAVPRIFVCGKCKTLHIPSPGYKLSRNNGYYYKAKNDKEFEDIIIKLDLVGSRKGRQNTLYNETNITWY